MSVRNDDRILTDTISVAALSTIVKCAGMVKVIMSARAFGPGDALDTYLLAFLIPSFLADLLAGNLGVVLLPALVRARATGADGLVSSTYGHIMSRALLGLSAVAVAVSITSTSLLKVLAGSYSESKIFTTQVLLLIMMPI